MKTWDIKIEEELTVLIKDWLKSIGRTQTDLGKSLNSNSSRMPALIETLKKEYKVGGMPFIASKLCEIEKAWRDDTNYSSEEIGNSDPFNQLDLILKELKEKSSEGN